MVIAKRITVSLDARLCCDVHTLELLVHDDDGNERLPTIAELRRISNGYRIYVLGEQKRMVMS